MPAQAGTPTPPPPPKKTINVNSGIGLLQKYLPNFTTYILVVGIKKTEKLSVIN